MTSADCKGRDNFLACTVYEVLSPSRLESAERGPAISGQVHYFTWIWTQEICQCAVQYC